ncbi:hypothetical protein ACHAXH_002668 [Discostella pseudostelligera]
MLVGLAILLVPMGNGQRVVDWWSLMLIGRALLVCYGRALLSHYYFGSGQRRSGEWFGNLKLAIIFWFWTKSFWRMVLKTQRLFWFWRFWF